MIVIRIKMKVGQSNKEELLSYLTFEAERNQTLPGCLNYSLYQDLAEPEGLLLYEEWENVEHFEAYKNSLAFKEIMAKVFPLLAGKPDSAHFDAEIFGP